MISNVIELRRREIKPEAPTSLSAIERRFPRIASELTYRWRRRDIDTYIDSLLIDNRGNRMGFPSDVLEEIMFLAGVRWYQGKDTLPETLESPRDEFSFHSDELRRCGNGTTWVLT